MSILIYCHYYSSPLTSFDVVPLPNSSKHSKLKRSQSRVIARNVIELPRGGYLVSTDVVLAGGVQFGIPPETIKDSLNLGLEVPHIFVILGGTL